MTNLFIIVPILLICIAGLLLLHMMDVKLIKKWKTRAKSSEERFKIYMDYINNGIFDNILEADITTDNLIGENSKKLAVILNLEATAKYSELINVIARDMVKEEYAEEYVKIMSRERITDLYNQGVSNFEHECVERLDNINFTWSRLHVHIFRSDVTNTLRIVSYVKNVDKEKKKELALIEKAQIDPLTGLYNKASVYHLISNALLSCNETKRSALLVLDIDNFKNFNDTFGHMFGDNVLLEVSSALKSAVRRSDIVGRIGGDEFIILLHDIPSTKMATEKADDLCNAFQSIHPTEPGAVKLSCSIGIAFSAKNTTYEDLFSKADKALYIAKHKGRNCYVLWEQWCTTYDI